MTRLLRFPLFKGCAAVLVIFLAFLLHSCAETPSGDSGRVDYLRFSLTADGMGHGIGSGIRGGGLSEMIEEIRVVCFNRAGDNIGVYEPEDVIYSEGCYSVAVENKESIDSFALLVNWSGYDVDLSSLDDLDALRNHTVSYREDSDMIPMYGEGNCDGSGDEINEVELVRSLAKIEVWDKLEGYSIESVQLKDRVSELSIGGKVSALYCGKEVTFKKDEESDMWYAYVPPSELGVDDSQARRIELKVDGEADNYVLWLKDYTDTENGRKEWETLQANHRYVFNVEGLERPTPPLTEPTGTIRIKWYPTEYGKFEEYEYRNQRDKTKFYIILNDGNGNINAVEAVSTPTFLTSYFYQYHVDINLEEYGYKFDNLRYRVVDMNRYSNDKPENMWSDELSSSLKEDTGLYPKEKEDDLLILRLNKVPIEYMYCTEPGSNIMNVFPGDRPYRIYWRNADIDGFDNIILKGGGKGDVHIYEIEEGSTDDYHFIEYELGKYGSIYNRQEPVPNIKSKRRTLFDWLYPIPFGIKNNDFFPQTIDGKDYYVFYVD